MLSSQETLRIKVSIVKEYIFIMLVGLHEHVLSRTLLG